MSRVGWVDATAGVAGDMLLGALVDAGADLDVVRRAVDAVLPGAVRLTTRPVTRAGLRATRLEVEAVEDPSPERHLADLLALLDAADGTDLADPVRTLAAATFRRLAEAEATVHGVDLEAVHFHEVGALDSIADVVGVCAAVHDLGLTTVSASAIAVGSGRMRAAHGDLPVPGPAVASLALGWQVTAGGTGELATPTGVALLRTLAAECGTLPPMVVDAVGVGAGSRDDPARPNVTRVVVGTPAPVPPAVTPVAPEDDAASSRARQAAVVLEANVDDLEPRLWPGVLAALLAAGADDAWLVPILMKKGRPAHTLCVLGDPALAEDLRDLVVATTTTFGVRQYAVTKHPLQRGWVDVEVEGHLLPVKVAHRDEVVVRATPEFDAVEDLASRLDVPPGDLLEACRTAAHHEGLRPGTVLATRRLRPTPLADRPAPTRNLEETP